MPELEPDWLAEWAATEPAVVALFAPSGAWTVAELDAGADSLAKQWRDHEIRPGERVATLLEDDAPAVLALHAARRVGAVLVPLNRRAAARELAFQVADVDAKVLFHDDPHETLSGHVAAAASVPTWSVHREEQRERPARQPAVPGPAVDLAAPATITFTSGTTGRPRSALLTHGNHAASADAWAAVLAPRASDRWLVCLPLYHVAGLAILVRTSRWQVPLEVLSSFEAAAVADRIEAGISDVSLVPTQLLGLLAAWGDRPVPSSLRAILVGGGPVPGSLLARARGIGLPVLTTYGQTETASGIAVGGADPDTRADPSALRPLPGVRVRIASPGSDGIGAIEVAGGMVFAGYVGREEALAAQPTGGWLPTGDLGSLDEGGLLRIADRRDDLIISGGENVYPAEVEAVLREHPAVLDAAVVGRPDERWGSVPVAAVVLAPGAEVEDADLERCCRERLASYKVPVGFRRFPELPRAANGKLLRRELRERLTETAEP